MIITNLVSAPNRIMKQICRNINNGICSDIPFGLESIFTCVEGQNISRLNPSHNNKWVPILQTEETTSTKTTLGGAVTVSGELVKGRFQKIIYALWVGGKYQFCIIFWCFKKFLSARIVSMFNWKIHIYQVSQQMLVKRWKKIVCFLMKNFINFFWNLP